VIVALTGWGQDEDPAAIAGRRFDTHLVKPVDHGVLDQAARVAADPRRRCQAAGGAITVAGVSTSTDRGTDVKVQRPLPSSCGGGPKYSSDIRSIYRSRSVGQSHVDEGDELGARGQRANPCLRPRPPCCSVCLFKPVRELWFLLLSGIPSRLEGSVEPIVRKHERQPDRPDRVAADADPARPGSRRRIDPSDLAQPARPRP
jgi:hypothetical protein